ncbi:MAG: hypothetical protein DDT42_01022 [candidate division WS2 bacterium]|uniref:Uncharacterized protein n=1 Tax=Psychracetigena formicireducens TaxID=2986056 RepID=A0A9E2F1Y9_PSYF1|nr:hypothetical protein [Candidatus Psychracetigena formicireducens]
MVVWSIIQKSQLEGTHRLDAEYYQPEYLEILKNLNRLKATPIKEVAISPKRKFKPKENEHPLDDYPVFMVEEERD